MRLFNPKTALLLLTCAASPVWASNPEWETYRGQPIVEIRVVASEIFDTDNEAENHRIFGWANALHIRTRTSVIRRELLFAEGDLLDPLLLEESERNLRNLRIFQDVLITLEPAESGVLVEVNTGDRWATKLITDLSSEGEITRFRFGLENSNFLGLATRLGGSIETSNDIDAVEFGFREPRLLGSRWDVRYRYAGDDLTILNSASLRRPYFSELVHWTSEFYYESCRGAQRLFEGGIAVDTLDLHETLGEAFVAIHGHRTLRSRVGLLFSRRSLTRDRESEQASVAILWSILRRDYRRMRNIDFFGTSEDVGSGLTLQLGVGADLTTLGADRDRPMWRADAAYARFMSDTSFFGLAVRHHGFARDGRLESGRLSAETYGFLQSPAVQTLVWSFGVAALYREPEQLQFVLGGGERLRGYEARHLSGTRALWFNVEERLFTDLQLLFLRFGAAAFVDMAQTWNDGESPALRDMHVGGGLGLRIGNNKSGNGLFRVDFAFGRNSFEISLSSGSFFRVAHGLEYLNPKLFR